MRWIGTSQNPGKSGLPQTEDDNITQKIAVLTAERDCYKSLCELAIKRREGESPAVKMVKEK